MSFHGGLLGVIVGTIFFAKKYNLDTLIYLDIIACVAPIGLFFGRIANFINGELYGKPTNLDWGVIFPDVDNLPRHPSQLYESFLEGIILFLILNFILIFYKNYLKNYLIFYSTDPQKLIPSLLFLSNFALLISLNFCIWLVFMLLSSLLFY